MSTITEITDIIARLPVGHREHIKDILVAYEAGINKGEEQGREKLLRDQCVKNGHRHPDGSSAMKGGFMMNFCQICGEDDY